jgi:hypothetical protein
VTVQELIALIAFFFALNLVALTAPRAGVDSRHRDNRPNW